MQVLLLYHYYIEKIIRVIIAVIFYNNISDVLNYWHFTTRFSR